MVPWARFQGFLILLILSPMIPARVILEDEDYPLYLDPQDRIVFPTDEEWEAEVLDMNSNRHNYPEIDPRLGSTGTKKKPVSKLTTGGTSPVPEIQALLEEPAELDFLKWVQENENPGILRITTARPQQGRDNDLCLSCGTGLQCQPPNTLSPSGKCVPRVNI